MVEKIDIISLRITQIRKIKTMESEDNEELPDIYPYWDNEHEGVYSEDPEDGYPYDIGTKVQE